MNDIEKELTKIFGELIAQLTSREQKALGEALVFNAELIQSSVLQPRKEKGL